MKKTKLMLVDDHQIVRDGVRQYLDKNSDYNIVAEAEDGQVAMSLLERQTVDIVIIDINMPRMNGIEATKAITQKYPEINVLALTMHNDYQHIKSMMDAGASGYVLKSCTAEELFEALEAIANDEIFYSQEVAQTVMNNLSKKKTRKNDQLTPLTPREKEIYRLILDEKTNQEIAEELFISVRTVEVHKRNLLEKTGAKNTTGLVFYAINNQLFDDL